MPTKKINCEFLRSNILPNIYFNMIAKVFNSKTGRNDIIECLDNRISVPPRTVIPATRAATNAVAACPSGCQPRLVAQTRRPATAAATIPVRIRRTQQTAPPPARRMRLAPACSGAALVPPRRI